MREINNNLNNVNFKGGIQNPVTDDKLQEEKPVQVSTAEPQKEITDLKNMPAAELGKSQVAGADSIEKDMKFLSKHPEVVTTLNEVIDKYAQTHSEEETLKFIDTTLKEFATK